MRLFLFCVNCFVVFSCCCQNQQLLYNFDSQPQVLMSNPGAFITFNKHLGIPLLSGFSVHAGSSGVSAFDVFAEGGDINNAINTAVTTLTDKDFFTAHQALEIISIGWESQRSEMYYSAGIYQELDAFIYYPRDIALLAFQGNAGYVGVPFDFSDVSFNAEVLSVYHFGVNRRVSKKLRLGARVKLYASVINVNSISNTGTFITELTPEGPNIYRHSLSNLDFVANTSGLNLSTRNFTPLSGNLGVGIDLGFTHNIDRQWTVTGSIIDLGMVRHQGDIRNYSATGTTILEGIEFTFPALLDGQGTTPYWDDLEDRIDREITVVDDLQNNYTTWRPAKFNGSIQYSFGRFIQDPCNCDNSVIDERAQKVGLQLFAIKRPKDFKGAVTAYYDKIWSSLLRTKVTYTYDSFSAKNIGALVSTKINNFNLYLAADNLLDLPNAAKAQSASLQLGMQLVFDSN